MYKTWRISFALKNTYRVNTILYAFKQIPLVKRLLPETLYLPTAVVMCSLFPVILTLYATVYHRERDRQKQLGLVK